MNTAFVIREWAAWAPTLAAREAWLAWATADSCACPALTDETPALSVMPAMSRRRLNPLGRMTAQVVYDLAGPSGADNAEPMLYASRYGDAGRSLALLAELARQQPISPTAFGLSVHNAIGALISIAREDRAHHSALAAGAASAGAALIEAAGLLADGEPSVIVVNYDTALPGEYAPFADEAATVYAWAWRIALPQPDEPCLRLALNPAVQTTPTPTITSAHGDPLPFGLGLLRFALSGQPAWSRTVDGQHWHWTRGHA